MLTTKRAIRIGRRGGQARTRNLSAQKRSEIAAWARSIREQKKRGEVTETEQRRRLIKLVRAENPDLAAFLKSLSRLTVKRAKEAYLKLSDEERELVECKVDEVLCQN